MPGQKKNGIMHLAGAMKNQKEQLKVLKSKIAAEREANYGRN
jgi:hypothetical protein